MYSKMWGKKHLRYLAFLLLFNFVYLFIFTRFLCWQWLHFMLKSVTGLKVTEVVNIKLANTEKLVAILMA